MDSTSPLLALNISIIQPEILGPRPKPIIFKIKKKRAVDIARIWIGAKVCAIAKLGPRYIPIKIKNNDVNTRFISTEVDHQAAIPRGRQSAIDIAGSHP